MDKLKLVAESYLSGQMIAEDQTEIKETVAEVSDEIKNAEQIAESFLS